MGMYSFLGDNHYSVPWDQECKLPSRARNVPLAATTKVRAQDKYKSSLLGDTSTLEHAQTA